MALALMVPVFLSPPARAASADSRPTEQPCDPDYMESLNARAWMEAEREITQNQNLIFKPDSVLEYTCYKEFMDVLAKTANDGGTDVEKQMLSESERWGFISGMGDDRIDIALEEIIRKAIAHWTFHNYGYGDDHPKRYYFLGGRSNPVAPTYGQGLDYEPDPPEVEPSDYGCGLMNKVWQEAKCMDFVDVPEEDGWFGYEKGYLQDADKRFLPFRCARPVDPVTRKDRWKQNIGLAYDDIFDEEDTTLWEEDFPRLFLAQLDPDNCGKKDKQGRLISPPIETGIFVGRVDQNPRRYREKICLQPGCHYIPYNETDGRCQKLNP